MITSPSFYRTIHKQEETRYPKIRRIAVHALQRHAAKIIVSFAVFVLLFTSFHMMGTDASSNDPITASTEELVVTVHAGDTLWTIAKQHVQGNEDIRFIIYKIKDRNDMQSADLKPGQKLIIPEM